MYEGYDVSVHGNHLGVNSEGITLEMSPDELQAILQIGHAAIIGGITTSFEVTKQRYPDHEVVRPSVFVLRLGTNSQEKRILTETGQANGSAIHREPEEIREKYHPYWFAVKDGGYIPEVRSTLSGPGVGGIWLMLRDSPYPS